MEIEQKYLLNSTDWKTLVESEAVLVQTYFNEDNITYRIRLDITNKKAFITWKTNNRIVNNTLVRDEMEEEVSYEKWEPIVISRNKFLMKKRSYIPLDEFTLEIDEFLNLNKPFQNLTLCEIEFKNITQIEQFKKPTWLGENVSADANYSNLNLFKHIHETTKSTNKLSM